MNESAAPELLSIGPLTAGRTLVLAHGAGQDMHSLFMSAFAVGLAARGALLRGLRVVRFNFPYMTKGAKRPPDREPVLLDTWRQVIGALETQGCPRERLVIGGKSLGGRMASLIADEQGVAGLVCLGYPFHPPGKPENRRTAHLETIATPTLICQGERDPFGNREEVTGYTLSPALRIHWVEDGDHGFKPRKSADVSEVYNWSSAMDAIVAFIATLDTLPRS